jgi:hypothetical protein
MFDPVLVLRNLRDALKPKPPSRPNPPQPRKPGFLDLPVEIRVMIYRHVFGDTRAASYKYWHSFPSGCRSSQILRTCKSVHNEARSILYQSFSFNLGINPVVMGKLLGSIGPINAGAISDLCITICNPFWMKSGQLPALKSFTDHKHRMNITSVRMHSVDIEFRDYQLGKSRYVIMFLASLLEMNPEFSRILASNIHKAKADLRLVRIGVKLESDVSIFYMISQGQN